MTLYELLIKIELMRYVMNTLASLGKSASDLLEISQQLDVLIVEYYRPPHNKAAFNINIIDSHSIYPRQL